MGGRLVLGQEVPELRRALARRVFGELRPRAMEVSPYPGENV